MGVLPPELTTCRTLPKGNDHGNDGFCNDPRRDKAIALWRDKSPILNEPLGYAVCICIYDVPDAQQRDVFKTGNMNGAGGPVTFRDVHQFETTTPLPRCHETPEQPRRTRAACMVIMGKSPTTVASSCPPGSRSGCTWSRDAARHRRWRGDLIDAQRLHRTPHTAPQQVAGCRLSPGRWVLTHPSGLDPPRICL